MPPFKTAEPMKQAEPMTQLANQQTAHSTDAAGSPPAEAAEDLAAMPTPEEAAEARRYSQATLRCTLIDIAIDLVVLATMAVVLGPAIDRWLAGFSWLAGHQSLLRLAALGAVITALHSLASLPLSFYSGYVIEHRFGLSTQSRHAWATSWLKRSGLTLVFLTLMYTGLFAIIWNTGAWWWLVGAGVFFLVSAVLGQLAPVVILPLFYKVERLEDDGEAQRLKDLAAGTGLEIEGVFRLGMSAETTKANAMLAGMGSTRRVLLGDTLIEKFTPGEIDIVFAHELGHHVHKHLPKLLVMAGFISLAGFYVCHVALGAWTGLADPAQWPTESLPKVAFVLTLFSLLVGPLQGAVSRHFERQADRYAIDRTGDPAAFRSAFLKLARINKAELDVHPLEVMLLHSHPPIQERLALAQ